MSGCFPAPLLFLERRRSLYDGSHHSKDRSVSAREQRDSLEIDIEAPGVPQSAITVTGDPRRSALVVVGTRTNSSSDKDSKGRDDVFRKMLAVPSRNYALQELTWNAQDGVIRIRIPKHAEAPSDSTGSGGAPPVVVPPAVSSDIEAIRDMPWPPVIEHEEDDAELRFRTRLPDVLTAQNVDVHLRAGGVLGVSLRAHRETEEKDEFNHVSFSESHSLLRAASLRVPLATKADDVAVRFDNHTLYISVRRRHAKAHPSDDQK